MTPQPDRLDPLLAAWADQHRLDPHAADGILRAILDPAPPALPVNWWADLSRQVSAAVVMAATRPAAWTGTAPSGASLAA